MPLLHTCALLLPLLCPLPFASVDDALGAWREGEALEGRVSRKLGIEAAARISAKTSRDDLTGLARIGWAGGGHLNVATRLVTLVVDEEAEADVALVFLSALRPQTLGVAVKGRETRWRFALERRALVEPAGGAELALELLVRDTEPGRIVLLLGAYALGNDEDPGRLAFAEGLIDACARSAAPEIMLTALARLEARDELTAPLSKTFATLLRRDGCAALAIQHVDDGQVGSGHSLFRALVHVPVALRDQVLGIYWREIESGTEASRPIAIQCAAQLKLPELISLIGPLSQPPNPPAVRVAAIQAIPRVFEFDVGLDTVGMLILLLEDPVAEVRAAAYAVLKAVSGLGLSSRVELWQQWATKTKAWKSETGRLRRPTGGGGVLAGGGFGAEGGTWTVGDRAPAAPPPAATPPPQGSSSALVGAGVTVAFLLAVAGLAFLTRSSTPEPTTRVLSMTREGAGERGGPRRLGAQAWSQSFSRSSLRETGKAPTSAPATPESALADRLERIAAVIDDSIPEETAPKTPREGPSPWTMKLQRLVGGGGLKVYREDEELDLPEFVAEECGGESARRSRVPLASQKLSRLLSDDDVSGGTVRVGPAAPDVEAPGKITHIINAAAAAASAKGPSGPADPRWRDLEQRRADEERRLWDVFRGLGPEGETVRRAAAKLIPGDIAQGSRFYEDALRIRILHLMRERFPAEPDPDDVKGNTVVHVPAASEGGLTSTALGEDSLAGLSESELEKQLLAIQQGEVLAQVFDEFVGPPVELLEDREEADGAAD